MTSRRELLERLVRCELPLEHLAVELLRHQSDPDDELVQIPAEIVVTVLDRYLAGQLNANQLEAWAQSLELRDDVDFPPPHASLLRRTMFRLANPVLHDPLTPAVVSRLRERLSWETA